MNGNENENGIYKLYHSFFLITLVPQGVPNAGVLVDTYFSITFPLTLLYLILSLLSFASLISILIFFNYIDFIVECGEYILSFIDFTSYSLFWILSFFDFYLVSFYLLFVLLAGVLFDILSYAGFFYFFRRNEGICR